MSARHTTKPRLMTVDEFFDWQGAGAKRYELIDGVPVAMAPAFGEHGFIQYRTGRLLDDHLQRSGRSCRVGTEVAIVPGAGNNMNVRVPDVVVTCARQEPGFKATTDPVVVVEILSKSNEKETRNKVWSFLTIPSLRDLLLLRADRIEAEVLSREPGGTWPQAWITVIAGGTISLPGIGFSAPLDDFYRGTTLEVEAGGRG